MKGFRSGPPAGWKSLAASAALPQRASDRVEVVWLRPLRSRSAPPAGRKLVGCVRCASAAGLRQGGSWLAAFAALPQRASGRVEIVWLRPLRSRSGPPAGRKLVGCVRCASAEGLRQGGSCLAASATLPQRASGREEVGWLRSLRFRSGPPAGRKLLGCVRCAPAAGLRQGGSWSHRLGGLDSAAAVRERGASGENPSRIGHVFPLTANRSSYLCGDPKLPVPAGAAPGTAAPEPAEGARCAARSGSG